MDSILLTRRIVARSEINTSIHLFLSHQDPVSAHVLAWASIDVLKGVANSKDIVTYSRQFEEWMGESIKKQYYQSAKKEYNFFKHSDRNPDAEIDDFVSEDTASVLMQACMDYRRVYGQMTWPMYMFLQWYLCRNPDLIKAEYKDEMAGIVCQHLKNPSECEFETSTIEALAIIEEGKAQGQNVLARCWDLIEP